MAVQFVIGRAGSGKTRRCLTSIVAAAQADPLGPLILWILPRQATFTAERELACNTALGGTLRVRVLSFEELGHEVLAECGGASVPEITPLGRQMLIGHLLRREASKLKYFRGVARQPGLAAQLDRTFTEFERAGKDAGELDVLLKGAVRDETSTDNDDALLDKVHDLQLIYRAYSDYVGQDRFDQHRRLESVLKCIASAKCVKGATVYCDDFREFTEYERRVLAALGKSCRHVEITFSIDPRSAIVAHPDVIPEAISLFHPVEVQCQRLRKLLIAEGVHVIESFAVLANIYRFSPPALQFAEKHVIGPRVISVCRKGEGIEFVDAPDRQAEVDAAARRILDLVRAGTRFRDVAVLTRDLSLYADLIAVSFGEHGIRYFTDRRRSMSHHPLLRCVRAVLAVARGRWPHEPMMELLKTELAGLTAEQGDALENYVLTHRLRGVAWEAAEPWTYGVAVTDEPAPPPPAEGYRRTVVEPLREFIAVFRGRANVTAAVKALFKVLEDFGVRARLAGWIAEAERDDRLEEMAEHQQVWTEVTQLFDEMVTLLGEERVTAGSFSDILEAGLEQFDLALTPPTMDEVIVGEFERTRTPELKAVLVLGLNDGVFPRAPKEDSVLSDADRRFLGRHDLDLRPPVERQMLDEDLLAYVGFTRASELLYVSKARSDPRGRPLEPSKYFVRLSTMFPNAERTTVPREAGDDLRWLGTRRQLVGSLARWARRCREPEDVDAASPWPAVYAKLAEAGRGDERWKAWDALSYANDAALTPKVAAKLFATPLHATAAELETFAACPFKHFLEYGLHLRGREEEDVSPLDLGSVYHHVLERIVGQLLRQRKSWADLGDGERTRMIRAAAEEIGQKLRGEIFLGSARNKYLLDRIERTLGRIVQGQQAGSARGTMKPAHTRLKFGPGERLPELAIATPRGREVRLSGKIDRVDVTDGHAAVVDYRLGGHALSLAKVFHGIELQLLTYLLVLDAHGERVTGKRLTPAAAFYVGMLRRLGEVKHPDDAVADDHPTFHLQAKPRGLLAETVVPAFDSALTEGTSEVVHCSVKKDGTFGSKGRSDLASAVELTALLAHVKRRLGELADELLDGAIDVRPYLLDRTSPCPNCPHRPACRFQGSVGYRLLPSMGREEVLLQVTVRGEGGARGD